ncbi:hypothetical protein KQI33_06840 [Enterococcus devriesei]|nr:competence type IV pilus minor pilin ComGG [Enterococcus devriesei]MBU5365085.1 hypothetical protein [Enterococcus devriesei]
MENKKVGRGSINSQGGILLSVLLAIFLFSFLLLKLTVSYHQTADLVQRTQQLYEARIAKELFLAEYKTLDSEKGTWVFNKGVITYEKRQEQLVVRVKMEKKIYYFFEKNGTSNSSE